MNSRSSLRLMVLSYSAIACAWSWLCWLGAAWVKGDWGPPLGGAIGTFGPTVAAVTMLKWQSFQTSRHLVTQPEPLQPDTRRLDTAQPLTIPALLALGRRWRFGWFWYFIVLVLPLLIALLALALYGATGGTVVHVFRVNHWVLVPISYGLGLILGGPLGEEFGWRGFLLPLLQSRMSALRASLWIGLIWAGWHLPLFFIPGQLQQRLPFGLFLLNTIALSILFTWVVNSTRGSVFSAILLHTSVNYWSGVIAILPPAATSLRPYAIAVLLSWIAAVLVVWRVGPTHLAEWQHEPQ